jgi:hypothetical protein
VHAGWPKDARAVRSSPAGTGATPAGLQEARTTAAWPTDGLRAHLKGCVRLGETGRVGGNPRSNALDALYRSYLGLGGTYSMKGRETPLAKIL